MTVGSLKSPKKRHFRGCFRSENDSFDELTPWDRKRATFHDSELLPVKSRFLALFSFLSVRQSHFFQMSLDAENTYFNGVLHQKRTPIIQINERNHADSFWSAGGYDPEDDRIPLREAILLQCQHASKKLFRSGVLDFVAADADGTSISSIFGGVKNFFWSLFTLS